MQSKSWCTACARKYRIPAPTSAPCADSATCWNRRRRGPSADARDARAAYAQPAHTTAVVADGRVEINLRQQAVEILEFDPYDKEFYRVLGPDQQGLAGRADLAVPANP